MNQLIGDTRSNTQATSWGKERQAGGELPMHQEAVVLTRGREEEATQQDAAQQPAGANEGRGQGWTLAAAAR